jgi:hypothetical protein
MGEETDRLRANVGAPRRRPPTDEVTTRRRRALAKVLAYTIVAVPGAYSAVRSQYQAETETVAKVNREAAEHIVRLQEWSKANHAEAEAARREVADLRREMSRDRIELTKLLVRIARTSARDLRGIREPGTPPAAPTPPPSGPAAEVQRKVDAFAKPDPRPAPRTAKVLPALKRPAQSLEQLKDL